ncbi:hypothetical protein OCGS_0913 [Oceaniovalibus guishaninsula JLT2003]|uniref:ABC-type transport auxiliary lipoprotein component domain-containing protein n=1 Tax=Oceaniovalibus guishaninsula JLT2003 TaxID=1231392 RepID=K2HBK7_9RHOB|nr:ABC-type transport auxiliary lipoprotein family protein [Oceaniovalibus guishaninsula]EKE44878.1 hypothetical protein OCGS_0913 [Oceaniovalibus guishaninsula JLT2003]
MTIPSLTRRAALLGAAASLGGCNAISSLNAAATVLDTYDLVPPAAPTQTRRSGQTLLVARPVAPAALTSDRILVRPTPVSVTYLPEARWSDEVPALLQTLLVRSIAATGGVGYVGPSEGGPVPDRALLGRIDAFEIDVRDGAMIATVDFDLTLLRDRDQSLIASRGFRLSAPAVNDTPLAVVAAFQRIVDDLLPQAADWVVRAG